MSQRRTSGQPVPPEPHGLVADLDDTLELQALDVPQRRQEADVEHHRQADDLWAGLEVAEWAGAGI
jgi:hypothetical protein